MRNTIDPVHQEIGERIKELRLQKGWSQKQLATKAGITVQTVLFNEKGKRGLSSYTIRSIATALDVTSDYLLFGRVEKRFGSGLDSLLADGLSADEIDGFIEVLSRTIEIFRKYKDYLAEPDAE